MLCRFAPLLGAIFLNGCLWSSGDHFGSVKPKHEPDRIWINNLTEPEWIDPAKTSEAVGIEVVRNTFAGLVQPHPKTLAPMPDIATHWNISKDGKTLTFHLRKSTWSDGHPLTAHDFEWSWKRALDPKTASTIAIDLYPLQNGKFFNQKALHFKNLPTDLSEKELRTLIESIASVDEVSKADNPGEFFVLVGGENSEKPENRQKVLDTLHHKILHGKKIRVQVADSSVVGVQAKSDETLVIHLIDPVPYFFSLLYNHTFMPVPRHVIERLENLGKNPALWTRPENVVSNGGYVLKEWKFRQYMLFEKNMNYWDAENVKTRFVKALMIESYNTMVNYYRGGSIDWTGKHGAIPSEYFDKISPYKDFHVDSVFALYYYTINTNAPPMDDVRVRKALSLAVDRESIVKHISRTGEIPTANFVPAGLPFYTSKRYSLHDPQLAKKYLAQAGYPDGKGFPKVTLIYNTAELHKNIAETVQQMWKNTLGIKVDIENLEWKVYLKKLLAKDYQIARLGGTGAYLDPHTFFENFSAFSGSNYTNWSSTEYDQLLNKANGEMDPNKRLAILQKLESILDKNQPTAPFFVYTKSYLKKPYLKGMWPNLQDRHPWKYMWIDTRWYHGVPSKTLPDNPPQMPTYASK